MGPLTHSLRGEQVYLDTNVFIYALEGIKPWSDLLKEAFQSLEAGAWQATTSALSLAECLVRPLQLNRQDIAACYQIALTSRPGFEVAPIDTQTLLKAAELRAKHGFKLPDAIHAATALQKRCSVILTNDNGFRRIPQINCVLLSDWQ